MEALALGAERLVHVDLKGAPPKLCFFEKFLPFIKSLGATGILLEWEDTFPYTRELQKIGGLSNSAQVSGVPYTPEEARELLSLIADVGLICIPLVQTFGHLEFVLKHEQWKGLREVEMYPSSMCPSHSEAMLLVRAMVRQIVTFYETQLRYIHIGADEVWHLGVCPECQRRVQSSKYGKAGLYLDQIVEIVDFIKDTFPHLKVIMWDDMLRGIDVKTLLDYNIGALIEPMVWHYQPLETFNLGGAMLWEKYNNVFTNVWIASAFKGATSSCQLVPINKYHTDNQEAWLNELAQHGNKLINFRGIAFTGWSRYDHYATLCELLPCGVPSLALCLKTWLCGGYNVTIHESVGKLLGYNDTTTNFGSPLKSQVLPQLSFPGWQVFVGFEWYLNVKTRYRNLMDSDQLRTWMNQWQLANNYTNPMQIDAIMPVINELLGDVNLLETYFKLNLKEYFYSHTIEEIMGTLIIPIKDNLVQFKGDCESQLQLGCRVRGQKRLSL